MSKLSRLLERLGISLTPFDAYVESHWGHILPTPLIVPTDPQSYREFITSLSVNEKDANQLRPRNATPAAPVVEKRLSTARLMQDVADHLISSKSARDDNAFVSGFAYKWVFSERGEGGGSAGVTDVGSRNKGVVGNNSNDPVTSNNDMNIERGFGSHAVSSAGAQFRLQDGTGTESLQYFTTMNWKILHSRLGDDILFELLTTKMIFAACGYVDEMADSFWYFGDMAGLSG